MDRRSDFLARILADKRAELTVAQASVPEALLARLAEERTERRPFASRLAEGDGVGIVAEIKRASPSRGPIRLDLDLAGLVEAYARGGAAAISVLTDRGHFSGDPDDLRRVRALTPLPLLRKDFILSSYQLHEAVVLGADAVLLIVRALTEGELTAFLALCRELRLDALVEVHSEPELERATAAGAELIGINNRDLDTFRVDLDTSVRLAARLAPGQIAVAESGIHTRADIDRVLAAGVRHFLVGESLVRSPDPAALLRALRGATP
jgi:indole-3-glycerol phosphate synthase